MRLLSLVLALIILGAIIIYDKDSLVPVEHDPQETVKEQVRQVIDEAQDTAADLQQQLEQQNRRVEELRQQN